jgi:hypothetical protein
MPNVTITCPDTDCDHRIDVQVTTTPGRRHPLTNTLDLHVGVDQDALAATIATHVQRWHRLGMTSHTG